MASFPGQSG